MPIVHVRPAIANKLYKYQHLAAVPDMKAVRQVKYVGIGASDNGEQNIFMTCAQWTMGTHTHATHTSY